MSEHNDIDFELELEKSIEKLIDEETSVAKAFVDRTGGRRGAALANRSQDSVNGRKTQSIPDLGARNIPLADGEFSLNAELLKNAERVGTEAREPEKEMPGDAAARFNTRPEAKKPMDKKTWLTLIGIGVGVILLIAGIVLIAANMEKGEKSTYSYNYTQGMEHYNANRYSEAIAYFEKAVACEEGKKNIDVRMKMYECYMNTRQEEKGVQVLGEVLTLDKYNEKAITALLKYYNEKKDGDSITRMVKTYIETNGEKYIAEYVVQRPTASVASGSYTDAFELELKAADGCMVYYTTDNAEPTRRSTPYASPIKIENGERVVKAVAVNAIGVASQVLELKYIVNYQVPAPPEVTPAVGGTYETGTKVTIANLNEGDTAYYTLDGTTPTRQSAVYKGPFDMPEGNIIVSVMVVNKHNLESSVTKKNYIVIKAVSYTDEEAKELLIAKMKSKGDVKPDGRTPDGAVINLVYFAQTMVNKEEMYLWLVDIKYNNEQTTERQAYCFGVGTKTGKCYRVYEKNGMYTVMDY